MTWGRGPSGRVPRSLTSHPWFSQPKVHATPRTPAGLQELVLPIPILGEWKLALLGLLLAAGGLWHLRRA